MKKNLLLLMLLFFSVQGNPDMGAIPFVPNIKIFEPNQRAIIAWNGKEEILLLSTDLKASGKTKVLEVMPLPSEPKVEEGNLELFKKTVELINSKRMDFARRGMSASFDLDSTLSAGTDEKPPAAEITFHDKIGAHEIFTVKLVNGDGFIQWVEDYFKKQNIDNPGIPEALKTVINEYIRDGYVWFVFDVVSLDENIKSKQALKFSFKTDFMYYPLRITKVEKGDTSVELIILTRELVDGFMMQGIPRNKINLVHAPITVTSQELMGLSEEYFDFLGKPDSCKLRIWNIKDKLPDFRQDLIVGYTGVMKSLSEKYLNHIRSIAFYATNSEKSVVCFINKAGGVFTYDSKSGKLVFMDKIKDIRPADIESIIYSNVDKFTILFKDKTAIEIDLKVAQGK